MITKSNFWLTVYLPMNYNQTPHRDHCPEKNTGRQVFGNLFGELYEFRSQNQEHNLEFLK